MDFYPEPPPIILINSNFGWGVQDGLKPVSKLTLTLFSGFLGIFTLFSGFLFLLQSKIFH
jgi:hypothetical protein